MAENRKHNYFFIYTLLFLFMLPLIYHAFIEAQNSLIWNKDGIRQHYIALVRFGTWGREILKNLFFYHKLEIPLWDFHIGYGSDILTTLHYYVIGDPLNLCSIFVPSQYTEYLYDALILVRIYLSGLSFSFYCFEMGKNKTAALGGAFHYIFCGYMLYAAVRHPYFANPMIYLPLLFTGVERIFKKRKPAFFIWMVFISSVSNFYFFYMLALAAFFYVCVRFFAFEHTNMRKELCSVILQFACYALTGICMSAIILVPVLLQFFQTKRIHTTQGYPALYYPGYYIKLISSFLTAENIGEWSILGFMSAALFALFVLFGQKKRHLQLKAAFIIMTLMLGIPYFGKAFNGFSYVTNRWCFLYAALISYILAAVWDDIVFLKNSSKQLVTGGCLTCGILILLAQGYNSKIRIIPVLLLSAVWATAVTASRFQKKKYAYQAASACILLTILFHAIANSNYLYQAEGKNYASRFTKSGTAFQQVFKSVPQSIKYCPKEENSFFRYDTNDTSSPNSASILGENGISYYWSLENGVIPEYLTDMSLHSFHAYNYKSLDQRTFLNTLASVKYYIRTDRSGTIPYGYEYQNTISLQDQKNYEIYRNSYALPIAYTYETFIPLHLYQNMEDYQRQEALLQGIVLEYPNDNDLKNIPQTKIINTAKIIPYTAACSPNTQPESDKSFRVTKNNAKITLSFQGLENCETYLSIQGLHTETDNPFDKEFYLTVTSNDAEQNMHHLSKAHKNYKGQTNYLINLGYHENPQTEITIKFSKKGIYSFQNMKIICQPMDQYIQQTEKRKENRFEQEVIGTNTISGEINLPKDKILCFSIPYSKGWHAIVDGKKREPKRANVMFMALPLSKGSHKITLYYRTPGLSTGITLSILGFLGFAGICILQRRPRRRPRFPWI